MIPTVSAEERNVAPDFMTPMLSDFFILDSPGLHLWLDTPALDTMSI